MHPSDTKAIAEALGWLDRAETFIGKVNYKSLFATFAVLVTLFAEDGICWLVPVHLIPLWSSAEGWYGKYRSHPSDHSPASAHLTLHQPPEPILETTDRQTARLTVKHTQTQAEADS